MRARETTQADLSAEAAATRPLAQVRTLISWLGTGRRLTRAGKLTTTDARELTTLLDTGDGGDEGSGGLTVLLAWAEAAGLVRVSRGRLVAVRGMDRPLEAWHSLFEAFGRMGDVVCPPGPYASQLARRFTDGVAALYSGVAEGSSLTTTGAIELVWNTLIAHYSIERATDEQLSHWHRATDRDLRRTIDLLVWSGALARDEPGEPGVLRLTPLADWALRRPYGIGAPGEPVAQLRITLSHVDPPVWRRILVPSTIELVRLHAVIQAVMGWEDYHLHLWTHHSGRYGEPDPEFDADIRDERGITLRELALGEGDAFSYRYDFGDCWDHEILVEKVAPADAGVTYPLCVAGDRACPPEDSGGARGYAILVRARRHDIPAADFDPARFDVDAANARLDSTIRTGLPVRV